MGSNAREDELATVMHWDYYLRDIEGKNGVYVVINVQYRCNFCIIIRPRPVS